MTITTSDPRLFLPPSGEVARLAREGLLAEWDMATFDADNAKLMLDQSGNGFNALFTATPTLNTAGVTFTGAYWADAVLPMLSNRYSALVVFAGPGPGYHVFGNRTQAASGNGTQFQSGPYLLHGVGGNQCAIAAATGTNVWQAPIAKVYENNQARANQITGGILEYTNTLREEDGSPDTQTVWRIGGTRTTSGGDPNAIGSFPMNSGGIAWAMVWDHITSERQDAAIAAYLRAKLLPRGVLLAAA
jgi:hypothetical protein